MGEMFIAFPSGLDGDDLQGPILIHIDQGAGEKTPDDRRAQMDQSVSPYLVHPDKLTTDGDYFKLLKKMK